MPAVTAQPLLGQDELAAMLAEAADLASLSRGPLPAVLDTDFVRTGLHYQLRNGRPPRSVRLARDGSVRLFMEYDTLAETSARLPRFAAQLDVPEARLRQILNRDWLPHIAVVQVPPRLREADPRALDVRAVDPDDFPAAALTALLSPCLLLTCNYRHFGVLGVRTSSQGKDAVMAVVAVNAGEMQLQAAVMVPAIPVRAAAGVMRSAYGRIGPAAWVIAGAVAGAGIWWYCKQPPERRERIRTAAGQVGTHLAGRYQVAAAGVYQARVQLRACMVPRPGVRTPASAIIRELALSPESLSAARLAELLDPDLGAPAASVRAFLREHDGTVFRQVRRGGFVLGCHYQLPA